MNKEKEMPIHNLGGVALEGNPEEKTVTIFGRTFNVTDEAPEDEKELGVVTNEYLKQINYEQKSGVSKRFYHVSLDNFKTETSEERNILQTVREFTERIKTGDCDEILMMCGSYGTGKTHLGCAVLRQFSGLYTTSFKLCLEYEKCSDFRSKEDKLQMLERYSKQKVLVIDEIGRGAKQEIEKEVLANIICQRYENILPTVLISNMTKKQLSNYLGMAVYDRFEESCVSLVFTGESKRYGLRKL